MPSLQPISRAAGPQQHAYRPVSSTDTPDKVKILQELSRQYPHAVVIEVYPDRGRDLGPFVTGFASQLRGYDVIGHVHGKRSLEAGATVGESWRDFLSENLVGGEHAMADVAAAAFAAEPALGLLMAEDPHLVGWNENRALAEELAARMHLTQPLDDFFDFPLGTMFWARPAALRPILALGLGWDDFPPACGLRWDNTPRAGTLAAICRSSCRVRGGRDSLALDDMVICSVLYVRISKSEACKDATCMVINAVTWSRSKAVTTSLPKLTATSSAVAAIAASMTMPLPKSPVKTKAIWPRTSVVVRQLNSARTLDPRCLTWRRRRKRLACFPGDQCLPGLLKDLVEPCFGHLAGHIDAVGLPVGRGKIVELAGKPCRELAVAR